MFVVHGVVVVKFFPLSCSLLLRELEIELFGIAKNLMLLFLGKMLFGKNRDATSVQATG